MRHNDKKFNTEKKSEGLEIVLNDFTFTPVTCSFHDYICVTRTEIFFLFFFQSEQLYQFPYILINLHSAKIKS